MIKLWRYNTTTGIWVLQRLCNPETAAQWLAIFQKDMPSAQFKLSKNKPPAGSGERGYIAI
jgi:hypothetical protein